MSEIERAITKATGESMLGNIARSSALNQIFTHVDRMDMGRRDPTYVRKRAGKDLQKLISLAQAALGRVGRL